MTLTPEINAGIDRDFPLQYRDKVSAYVAQGMEYIAGNSQKYIDRIEAENTELRKQLEDARRPSARETLEANQAAVKK